MDNREPKENKLASAEEIAKAIIRHAELEGLFRAPEPPPSPKFDFIGVITIVRQF